MWWRLDQWNIPCNDEPLFINLDVLNRHVLQIVKLLLKFKRTPIFMGCFQIVSTNGVFPLLEFISTDYIS